MLINPCFPSPKTTVLTSGSGNFVPQAWTKTLRVKMIGGGGGACGGASGANGSSGGSTTFGANSASGGGYGQYSGCSLGVGQGALNLGVGLSIAGAQAGYPSQVAEAVGYNHSGSMGAPTPFGGGGFSQNGVGGNAQANTGAGGGSGMCPGTNASYYPGTGGGAGNYMEYMVTSPASSIAYSIGAGGAGGAGANGAYTGGAGGSGVIYIEEWPF